MLWYNIDITRVIYIGVENLNKSKIEFRISKVLFPKNGQLELGEYSIISCWLVREISGQFIEINPTYKTFSLLSYTPVIFNEYDTYVATVEPKQTQYGISYNLIEIEKDREEMSEGDKRAFLEMVLTPLQVDALYSAYTNPYDLIAKKDKEKLCMVKGIGEKSINFLFKKYDENLKYSRLMVELKEFGLSKAMMDKLLFTYKDVDVVIEKVKDNPYILADEVNGIGFKKADALAINAGMPKNSPKRLEAFFQFFLNSIVEEGNSWVKPKVLFGQIEDGLGVKFEDDIIRQVLYNMKEKEILSWNEDKTKMFLTKYLKLEEDIYKEICRLQTGVNKYKRNKEKENSIINTIEENIGFELTEEQKRAVDIILDNNISLLVGNAGVGKTVITKVFTSVYKQSGLSVALCTLSGKASARIQEATGFNGSTIHRLLGFVPDIGFKYNKDNPLPYDVIIVDESSFVGGELFYDLISAIKEGGKLILVGDDKQLPSIGMCNIFFDMINSKKIAMAKLTQIHRQAQKSGIIVASKMVREGTQLVKNGWVGKETRGELQDFTIDVYDNKLYSNPKIIEWYRHYVKDLSDTFKTQIIVPMKYRGDFNTFDLNNQIQAIFNPKNSIKKEILLTKNGKTFVIREGDKVINRKNNYHAIVYKEDNFKNNVYKQEFLDIDEYGNEVDNKKYTEIFNGFCGEVVKIVDNKIIVKFDLCDDLILFDYESRNNLELAYALTTHLFQGSQIENVIVGIDNGSYIMNTKELVYTAITRASKECVLLCEGSALKHAINTSQTNNKNTFLASLLKQEQI